MGIFNFVIDIFDALVDIRDTWREKDEKILSKIICTIITLGCIIISAKIWL